MSMNYIELKVSELREECKLRNLDTSGLKVHLVDRLNTYDKNQLLKSKSENKTIKNLEHNKSDASIDDNVSSLQDKTDLNFYSDSISENGSGKSVNIDEKTIEKVQNKEDRKRSYESNDLDKDNLYKLAEESLNWESCTDVHLDFYNSDMNFIISDNGYSGMLLHEDGFQYVCAGLKGNYGVKSGKVYFEVKISKKLKIQLNSDAGESNFIRIGWSANNEFLTLGEFALSFCYDSFGKKLNDGHSSDYGVKIDEGDVVGCFLEFNGDSFIIRYTVNGEDQSDAFTVLSRELKDHVLVPHIYVRNISFEVNFGQNEKEPLFPPKTVIEGSEPIQYVTWTLLGKINLNQRTRAMRPPKEKESSDKNKNNSLLKSISDNKGVFSQESVGNQVEKKKDNSEKSAVKSEVKRVDRNKIKSKEELNSTLFIKNSISKISKTKINKENINLSVDFTKSTRCKSSDSRSRSYSQSRSTYHTRSSSSGDFLNPQSMKAEIINRSTLLEAASKPVCISKKFDAIKESQKKATEADTLSNLNIQFKKPKTTPIKPSLDELHSDILGGSASEDIVWDIIKTHCSFMCKTKTEKFCKNEYSISGLCNRTACPLANYRYATIKEKDNILYLYIREAERMPYPAKHWEIIKLKENVDQALEQINLHLIYWPKQIIKKVKTRFACLKSVIKRKRQIALNDRKILIAKCRKSERNENRREMKAEKAGNLDKSIETELFERLAKKNRIANLTKTQFENYLKKNEDESNSGSDKEEEAIEFVEVSDIESEEEIEETRKRPVLKERNSRGKPKVVIGEDSDEDSD